MHNVANRVRLAANIIKGGSVAGVSIEGEESRIFILGKISAEQIFQIYGSLLEEAATLRDNFLENIINTGNAREVLPLKRKFASVAKKYQNQTF